MFFHYSIILIILKKRQQEPDQQNYNNLFFYIENNLRELGFGDVSVNKKMKDLNKIFYDILIKINLDEKHFELNRNLVIKYFNIFSQNEEKWKIFESYFLKFYNFCFEKPPKNMIESLNKYKY